MNNVEDNTQLVARGGWSAPVYERLEEVVAETPADRRLAAFDFDNTCIRGDIGELFGHYLVETMRYRYDLEAFWELIEPKEERRRMRRLTDRAMQIEPDRRPESKVYRQYLAQMAGLYARTLERFGKRTCYEWAVRLHVGLTEEQMRTWSAEAIDRELRRERTTEMYRSDEGRDIEIERGIRPFGEIRSLIETLQTAGWDVWIVSASNVWTIRTFAPRLGVEPDRVLGNRVEVRQGRLTSKTRRPVLFREGKREAIREATGRRPALAFGDAITDLEMMESATELAVLIDRGDESMRNEARERGWAIQSREELTLVGT